MSERVVLADDFVLYTVPGAAAYLDLPRSRVERLIREGMPAVAHGGRRLISEEALDAERERLSRAASTRGTRATRFRPPPRDQPYSETEGERQSLPAGSATPTAD